MKKIIKLLPIVLLVFALSCEQDDNASRFTSEPSTGWVEFNTPNAGTTISTSTQSLTLPVGLRVPIFRNGVDVSYSIVPVQGDPSTILTTGNTVSFSGEELPNVNTTPNVKNIVLNFEGVADLTEVIVFDVVLTSVNVSGVSIGIDDNSIVSYRVSTPCPLIYADSYNVDVAALGGTAPSHTVDLVPLGGGSFFVSSTWGPNFVGWATGNPAFDGQFPYDATITVNEDLSVDVVSDTLPGGVGSGSYDSCNDVFLITLQQGLFTTDFTVDITMTAAN